MSLITTLAFVPIGTLVLILSYRARKGYLLSKKMLIKFKFETDSELFLKVLEAAEDHRYQDHWGIDLIAIIRAIRNFFLKRKLEGASTIEQQYVRTCTGSRNISLLRKLEELTASVLLSISSSKNDIAHSYISYAYFGEGLYGYKNVIPLFLSGEYEVPVNLYQTAAIIAMLKRPKPIKSTIKWENQLLNRVNYIVNRHSATYANKMNYRLFYIHSKK